MSLVQPVNQSLLVKWLLVIAIAMVAWFVTYFHLTEIADFILALTPFTRESHLGEAIHFFLYDTPKVLLLLAGIVFLMGIVQSFFSPERTRELLAGKRLGVGNSLAALLGIVTPFCSCSAVPLFIGFLSAGVPLGVTFSFLISAPMINEVALALLFGMFGWKVAGLYLLMGLSIAIFAGIIMLLAGLSLMGKIKFLTIIEHSLSSSKWYKENFRQLLHQQTLFSFFILGMLNGLLPCGLVYFLQ